MNIREQNINIVLTANESRQEVLSFDEQSPAEVNVKVALSDGAHLDVVFLQENVKSSKRCVVRVAQQSNSSLSMSTITLHSVDIKNDVEVRLQGEGAELTLNGLYLTDNAEVVDNRTVVYHEVSHCTTKQLYKGALDGESKASFEGMIIVQPNAQKTNAQQTNRNILISPKAKVHAEPQLVIYADDVKCSHGATTGQLDPVQLFYMQQRGIDEDTARKMLTAAYAAEVVSLIPIEEVRERLTNSLFD
ncbi:MAG: Fe-S cluster assembly protein SufD [Bacteroidales bacterium]|nr:Fe-S cluster assembly protein SufD [Bacteroidales bacterium]